MAEAQREMTAERPSPVAEEVGEPPSAPMHLAEEVRLQSRIQSLAIVFERLWLFYEAMRSGMPLTNADQVLAQVGSALRSATKRKHDSHRDEASP